MKKILSLILVATMLLTMCPMAFAEGETSTDTFDGYEYVFTRAALGSPSADIARAELAIKTFENVDSTVSDPWMIAEDTGGPTIKVDSNGVYFYTNKTNTDAALAIKINVEKGGTYVPELTYIAQNDAPIIDLYLAKEDVSSNGAYPSAFEFVGTQGAYYKKLFTFLHKGSQTANYGVEEKKGIYALKKLNMYSAQNGEETENFGNMEIDLEANTNYYLIYDVVGKDDSNKSGGQEVIFKSFSLTPAAEKQEYVFTRDALGSPTADIARAELATKTLENFTSDISDPWMIAEDTGGPTIKVDSNGVYFYTNKTNTDAALAIKIKVEQGGTYVPELTYIAQNDAPIIDLYLAKEDVSSNGAYPSAFEFVGTQGAYYKKLFTFLHKGSQTANYGVEENKGIYALKKLNMYSAQNGEETENFGNMEIDLKANTNYYLIYDVVGKDDSNKSGGQEVILKSFSLTPVKDVVNEEFAPAVDNTTPVTGSASVHRYAYYGGTTKPLGEIENVTYGESVTVPAPEQTITKDGTAYNFLYWTKGLENQIGANRQALSTALSFNYKPHEGVNYLIAVYEEESANTEAFYNANGQLLTGLKVENDILPDLPSMAGFDEPAQKWVQIGTGDEFDAKENISELAGKKAFIAKYADVKPTAKITINENEYTYNDEIICKNLANVNYKADSFSYWARTINGVREIVSVDPNYSFRAFTDCTVEAVCVGKINVDTPRKILLSTFNVGNMTAVMAEFIGFGDAKEKGIVFDGQKIAMTTDYAQFTVTNDKEEAVKVTGYAVVGNERITDGSITVASAE